MATRKKKAEVTEDGVKVVKGSHLTVYTYPDGKTKLEWDDEALARDVQEALASVVKEEAKVKPKIKPKVKAEPKPKTTRKKKES